MVELTSYITRSDCKPIDEEVKTSDSRTTTYVDYGGGNNLMPIICRTILMGMDIHLVTVVGTGLSKGLKYGGVNT